MNTVTSLILLTLTMLAPLRLISEADSVIQSMTLLRHWA